MNMGSLRHVLGTVNPSGRKRWRPISALVLISTVVVSILCCVLRSEAQNQQNSGVVARWTFHLGPDRTLQEQIHGTVVTLSGDIQPAPGPTGNALQMDGYTAAIRTEPLGILDNPDAVTITAWVKFDAYPWNRLPILDQSTPRNRFFLGVDATGHLLLKMNHKAPPQRSEAAIPLRQWSFITAEIDSSHVRFSINGVPTPSMADETFGQESPETNGADDLLIGHTRSPLLPGPPKAIHPDLPIEYSLEGFLGEITVFRGVPSSSRIAALYAEAEPGILKASPPPKFPRGEGAAGPFGAFYTSLSFDPVWDGSRRVGPDSDVVVRFPESPVRLVFWQGNNYVPAWVTENGHWYTDEFMEIFGHPRCPYGEDCEPMSDKQVRYSHVRILENTPARVVIHWRYALSEVQQYAIADAASPISWGDWADEYWTVYPDHVAIRRSVLWSTAPERSKTEFQESIVIIPPGETPEDSIHFDALTFANLKGQTATYSWEPKKQPGLALPKGPTNFPNPAHPVIQWVNLKSTWKPFEVVWGNKVSTDAYNGEASISSFEWWNHWPVAQIPSSGRPALAADRAGHTSLSHLYWPAYRETNQTVTKLLLTGLTEHKAAEMVPLANSWRAAPDILLGGHSDVVYDPAQRAYVFPALSTNVVEFTLHATQDRPLQHFGIVLPGKQALDSALVNGVPMTTVQSGTVQDLSGTRLVLFLPVESTRDTQIVLKVR